MFNKYSQNTPVEICSVPETSKSFIITLKIVLYYIYRVINPSFVWKYHVYCPVNCAGIICIFSTTNSQVSGWENFTACLELN